MSTHFNRIVLSAALLTGLAAVVPAQAADVSGATASDVALASQVQAALQASPIHDNQTDISVAARNGQVELTGFIHYSDDDMPARAIAAAVDGVSMVSSNFRAWSTEPDYRLSTLNGDPVQHVSFAAPVASPADAALAARVRSALLQATPFQDKDVDLNVTARDGHVHLSGWISYSDDDMPARVIATHVPGVRSVTSNFHAWSTETDTRI